MIMDMYRKISKIRRLYRVTINHSYGTKSSMYISFCVTDTKFYIYIEWNPYLLARDILIFENMKNTWKHWVNSTQKVQFLLLVWKKPKVTCCKRKAYLLAFKW